MRSLSDQLSPAERAEYTDNLESFIQDVSKTEQYVADLRDALPDNYFLALIEPNNALWEEVYGTEFPARFSDTTAYTQAIAETYEDAFPVDGNELLMFYDQISDRDTRRFPLSVLQSSIEYLHGKGYDRGMERAETDEPLGMKDMAHAANSVLPYPTAGLLTGIGVFGAGLLFNDTTLMDTGIVIQGGTAASLFPRQYSRGYMSGVVGSRTAELVDDIVDEVGDIPVEVRENGLFNQVQDHLDA